MTTNSTRRLEPRDALPTSDRHLEQNPCALRFRAVRFRQRVLSTQRPQNFAKASGRPEPAQKRSTSSALRPLEGSDSFVPSLNSATCMLQLSAIGMGSERL